MSKTIIDGSYQFEYLPTQYNVLQCVGAMKTPNIMYCGGFGSGKTRLACEIGLELGATYPGLEVGYFRKTRTAIKDTTYKVFVDEVVPEEYIKSHIKSTLEVTLRNGSYFHFFGIDNFQRKASLRFDVILFDEAIEAEEDDVVMLGGRLRGKVVPMPMIIYFCNPGAPGSYFHKTFVQNSELPDGERDNDFAYFSTNSFENTHNPKAYFDRLEKWKGTQYYERFVLGLWKAMKGVIWSNFEPKKHVIKPFPIPHNWPKTISIDFGYDNPMAVLWIAEDPGTGRHYVYRQLYHTGLLVKKMVEICKTVSLRCGEKIDDIIADHDAENRAQVEELWMQTTAARKEVMTGIQGVTEAFMDLPDGKGPGLFIFDDSWSEKDNYWYGNFMVDPMLHEENKPNCLQEEIPGYKWGKDDKPIKENDHACDALRYFINTIRRLISNHVKVHRQIAFARR